MAEPLIELRFALCEDDPEAILAARMELHDLLIAAHPFDRRGPVRWLWGHRDQVLADLSAALDDGLVALVRDGLANAPPFPIIVLALLDVDGGAA